MYKFYCIQSLKWGGGRPPHLSFTSFEIMVIVEYVEVEVAGFTIMATVDREELGRPRTLIVIRTLGKDYI